jgi:hypothetical protein
MQLAYSMFHIRKAPCCFYTALLHSRPIYYDSRVMVACQPRIRLGIILLDLQKQRVDYRIESHEAEIHEARGSEASIGENIGLCHYRIEYLRNGFEAT